LSLRLEKDNIIRSLLPSTVCFSRSRQRFTSHLKLLGWVGRFCIAWVVCAILPSIPFGRQATSTRKANSWLNHRELNQKIAGYAFGCHSGCHTTFPGSLLRLLAHSVGLIEEFHFTIFYYHHNTLQTKPKCKCKGSTLILGRPVPSAFSFYYFSKLFIRFII